MTNDFLKKRIGQYFSGKKVATLLVALCNPSSNANVIDPMAGTGDMLNASIHAGVIAENVYGIEIDQEAALICSEIIGDDHVFIGDAFSHKASNIYNKALWDLVITNPPYVRYQSIKGFENSNIKLKNAKEVRKGLGNTINTLRHLNNDEKTCFHNIINSYSGLSDLAVPSWLLCAALVKQGGMLAMVVPESWLNREYALSIKYLLLKLFDILYVVEDVNAAWFSEALVKTNLFVARRVALQSDFHKQALKSYKHIKLSAKLIGESSLIDGLHYEKNSGFSAFQKLLLDDISGNGFESKSIPMSDFISTMSSSSSFTKLMKKLDPLMQNNGMISIPNEIRKILHYEPHSSKIVGFNTWGIQVGQGLRTGANKFFYAILSNNEADDFDFLSVDSLFGSNIIAVAKKYSLPSLRYQSDIDNKYTITKDILLHRLLYIQEVLHDSNGNLRYTEDAPLVSHIITSDTVTFKNRGHLTRFRDMSAVKPNIGIMDKERHWYMLPPLTRRHLPDLCISRVNNKNTRCYLVSEGIVVDANFSTLWVEPQNSKLTYAIFALMNSTWVQACLESIATIMGGGALKVEASHIKALPLPKPTDKLILLLQAFGEQLVNTSINNSNDILLKIDEIIFREGLCIPDTIQSCERLRMFVTSKVLERKR